MMRLLVIMMCLLLAAPAYGAKRTRVSIPPGRPLTFEAIEQAARTYGVPLAPLLGILATENGRLGEALDNTNGTWDLGPFQINTCHLNDLQEVGFTPQAIMADGVINAHAAAWLLRQEIKNAGGMWHGVGHYHSRTPARKYAYIRKVRENMNYLQRHGLKSLPIKWEQKL